MARPAAAKVVVGRLVVLETKQLSQGECSGSVCCLVHVRKTSCGSFAFAADTRFRCTPLTRGGGSDADGDQSNCQHADVKANAVEGTALQRAPRFCPSHFGHLA